MKTPNANDTITYEELCLELLKHISSESPVKFGGYHSLSNLVKDMFWDATRKREAKAAQAAALADPEVLTKEELSEALVNLGYVGLKAEKVFQNVAARKEETWENEDIVIDKRSIVYQRWNGKWMRPGFTTMFDNETPVRPLKRLVAK